MRILLLATRHPYGRQSGRKAVLRTIVQACSDLGHEVRVLAITDESAASGDAPVECLAPPGLVRAGVNVLSRATTGRLSFNECLYVSPTIRRGVAAVCETWRADLVIADMLRTSSLALGTGLPTIVDLDDLLSRRYEELADGRADAGTVLGYYASSVPSIVRPLLARVAAMLIGVEARLVARRETVVGRAAQGVSLVAEEEAGAFGARIGRSVAWLPMAVDISPSPAPVATNPDDRIVFVGGLDYHANLEAVRTYVGEVAPALADLGLGRLCLRVIGHCPAEVKAELGSSPAIELLGYVDDLASELAGARAFVAPIPPGTGVKTKVLEAMAAGLPVVSTPDGVTGIGVVAGEHCLVGSTPTELAKAIARLVANPEEAARIGAAGRTIVEERFSRAVVTERWRLVLDSMPHGGAT